MTETWSHLCVEAIEPYAQISEILKSEKETRVSETEVKKSSPWHKFYTDLQKQTEAKQLEAAAALAQVPLLSAYVPYAGTRTVPIVRSDYEHTNWPWPAEGSSCYVAIPREQYEAALATSARRAARISELEARLTAANEETGNHDYHGPTDPDGRPIPDAPHENFHRAVGDVLSGKIMNSARRQMQEALKQAPKEAPTTASTAKPMPGKALGVPYLEKGVRIT